MPKSKRRLDILVDLDSTFVDIWTPTLANLNAAFGTSFTVEDMKEYNFAKNVGRTREEATTAAGWTRPGFYGNLTPYPGAERAVKGWVERGHRVFVATAHMIEAPHSAGDKIDFVHRVMPYIDPHNIFIGHTKHMIKADVVVDDSPIVLNGFIKHQPETELLALEFPYNRHLVDAHPLRRLYLAANWDEIDAAVLGIKAALIKAAL